MYFLLILLWFNFSSSSESTPRIDIEWDLKSSYMSDVHASMMYAGEKIEIHVNIKNVVERKIIEPKITCYNHTTNKILLYKSLHKCLGKENCYTCENKATPEMSTKWECAFINNGTEYHRTRPFEVQVRHPYAGILYINGEQRKSLSESGRYSNLSYNNYTHYKYVDGEMAKFECKIDQGTKILMEYQDKDQQIVIPEKKRTSSIYLKLHKSSEPNYLDCKVTQVDQCKGNLCTIQNTIRIFFHLKTLDYLTFKINDMVLTRRSNLETSEEITYNYGFYNDERVILGTVVVKNIIGLECVTNNKTVPKELIEFQKPKAVQNLSLPLTLHESLNSLQFRCKVKAYAAVAKEVKTAYISLVFKHIQSNGFRLSLYGFSWANVLAKYEFIYKDSNKNYLDKTIIQYSYRENEINLKCMANDAGIKWSFDNDKVENYTLVNETYNFDKFLMVVSFKLKPYHNRTTISCYKDYYGNTTIELIRDGPPLFEDEPVMNPPVPDVHEMTDIHGIKTHEKDGRTTTPGVSQKDTITLRSTAEKTKKKYNNENPKINHNFNKKPIKVNFSNHGEVMDFTSIASIDFKKDIKPSTNNIRFPDTAKEPDYENPNRKYTPNINNDVNIISDENVKQVINPDTDKQPVPSVPDKFDKYPETDSQTKEEDDNEIDSKNWKLIAIIIGTILMIVIVALIAVFLFRIYKTHKKERLCKENQSTVDYENLPEHNEGQMAIPRQWETNNEDTYAAPQQINTDLYAKPLPKNMRHKNDNIYTEIIHYRPDPTYSNNRKNVTNKTGNVNAELNYANIFALPNGDTYAEVVPKCERKPEVTYNNISSHCNNEYVEPAYAEINKQ